MSWVSSGAKKATKAVKKAVKKTVKKVAKIAPVVGAGGIPLATGKLGLDSLKKASKSKLGKALKNTILGTIAGGGVGQVAGLLKDKQNAAKQKIEDYNNAQQDKKDKANDALDDIINGITGDGSYDTNNPPMSFQPILEGYPSVAGGIDVGAGEAGKSAAQILAEADLARQYREGTLAKQKEQQASVIANLQKALNEEAAIKYQRELPGLYEELNSRGLLMSSHLGEQMSRRQQESLEDIATKMAQQQIAFDTSNIGEIKNISEGYLGSRGSSLQREQSLEDYARQLKAAKLLGAATTPATPYSGSSKSGNAANVIGGAGVGANFGPGGALIGAGSGALLGGK